MLIIKSKSRVSLSLVLLLICLCMSVSSVSAESSINKDGNRIKNVIENYYSDSYEMWMDLKVGNLSKYLDFESIQCYNKVIALEENIEKWKYGIEEYHSKDFREKHDIFFEYDSIEIMDNTAIVKVNLSGETKGQPAYPFFVALGENTFILKKKGSNWLINEHEYSNIYFYEKSKSEKISYDIAKLRKEIDKYQEEVKKDELLDEIVRVYPSTDYYYSNSRAVQYANEFVENNNSYFYTAGSDCTNFVSQCVSYGFGSTTNYSTSTSYRMVSGTYSTGWFGGSGGGSGPWESVDDHWDYMTSSKTNENGPRVAVTSWSSLPSGGIMQIDFDSDGDYDHSVICVDRSTEKFAQHSFNRYAYYYQYVGDKRFYKPSYFRVYE